MLPSDGRAVEFGGRAWRVRHLDGLGLLGRLVRHRTGVQVGCSGLVAMAVADDGKPRRGLVMSARCVSVAKV